MNLISVFIGALLTENVILTKFLGICSFLGTSNKEKNAVSMGICVTFVTVISTIITNLLYNYVLVPTNSTYLKTMTFILVIACFVQITELIMKKFFKSLYKSLGIYLPLITTNCAVFGIVLTSINMEYDLITSIIYSLGASLGFMGVLYIFSLIREKLDTRRVPSAFKGTAIALVTAGIMALIFARLI